MTQTSAKLQAHPQIGRTAGTQQTLTQLFTATEHLPTILPVPNLNGNGGTTTATSDTMDIKTEEKKPACLAAAPDKTPLETVKNPALAWHRQRQNDQETVPLPSQPQ